MKTYALELRAVPAQGTDKKLNKEEREDNEEKRDILEKLQK